MVKNVISVGLVIFALAPVPASMAADMGPEVMTDAAMDSITAAGTFANAFAFATASGPLALSSVNGQTLTLDTPLAGFALHFSDGIGLGLNPDADAGGSADVSNSFVTVGINTDPHALGIASSFSLGFTVGN